MKGHFTRLATVLFGLALCLLACQLPTSAGVLPHDLKIEKLLDNSVELGDLAQSPRGELWLLERVSGADQGTVRVFVMGKEADSLTIPVAEDCESGLLDVAFAPGYAESGLAFLYYVDFSRRAHVDQIYFNNGTLTLGSEILDLGTTPLGCQPGGGMAVGPDGKLYIATGDMENGANGQNAYVNAGKVLRTELDGSPADGNPSGTAVWAMGFRDGRDLTIDDSGHVYMSDVGDGSAGICDEINEVTADGNYGWDIYYGDDSDSDYYDPMIHYDPDTDGVGTVDPEGLVSLAGTKLGSEHDGALVMANLITDEMQELILAGTTPETVASAGLFYDPDFDKDGSIDPDCPYELRALGTGMDGWLYAAGAGTNPGIYRIYRDTPGPREVSAPGSPAPLTVDKDGAALKIGWEKLEARDAYFPARNGGQRSEVYRIWEGDFPITAASEPSALADTDGDSDGTMRLTWTGSPSGGDHYYLVSAQGDNLEGSIGRFTDGTERLESYDYCGDVAAGYGVAPGNCMEELEDASTGLPARFLDYNPQSPTYNQYINIGDFRGKAVKLDMSALNCVYCQIQANFHRVLEQRLGPRDVALITIIRQSLSTYGPIPPANCASEIAGWQSTYRETNPIICDTDLDSDGNADLYMQLRGGGEGCSGVPQNIFIDQGGVIWNFWCGAYTQIQPYLDELTLEANPETCE